MNNFLLLVCLFFGVAVYGQTNVHRVMRGETIYTISRLYGSTPAKIADINNLDIVNTQLTLGQKIIIPNKYYEIKKRKEEPKYKSYIIKQGDSYYSIARSHNLSVYDVVKINQLKGNTPPVVGSTIIIPVKENETQQISMQEVKMNLQQGDAKERTIIEEIEMEAKEYFFVKNIPYKRPKLVAEYKELPIQIFYRAEIKIDTGKVKKTKKSKRDVAGGDFSQELRKAKATQPSDTSSAIDAIKIIVSDALSAPSSTKLLPLSENRIDSLEDDESLKLTELISTDSFNAERYYQRAMLYYKVNQYALAQSDVEEAIKISQEIPSFYLLRANIFAKINEYKKAIEDLKIAEEKGIDQREIFMLMAMMYEREGDHLMAVNYYDREIETNPQNGMAFYLKALCLRVINQNEEACNSLKKAIDLQITLAEEAMKSLGCAE